MSLKNYVVIDDDPTNNLICEFVIKKKVPGAEVGIYNDPEAGLSFVEKLETSTENESFPIVLFLDINMPSMTGWEFLDAFKKIDPEIQKRFRIYMLSSSVEDFSEQAIIYPFVKNFLSKPLSKDHMDMVVGNLADEKANNRPV